MSPPRTRILFVCTGNSCRSQMAEAWTRHLLGKRVEAFSAGTAPHGLDPRAVEVMREAGIDMSGQYAKSLEDLPNAQFDLVVTVCDRAAEACPAVPGVAKRIHHGFPDPPQLAASSNDAAQTLQAYRDVRDQIREFILALASKL